MIPAYLAGLSRKSRIILNSRRFRPIPKTKAFPEFRFPANIGSIFCWSPEMITVRCILLVSLVPLVGWGLGFGLKSRFTQKKPPQKIDALTESERDALVANFSSQTGLPMHRMLAQTLPTTDLKLIRRLAEELAKRDQKTIQSVVWNALFSR